MIPKIARAAVVLVCLTAAACTSDPPPPPSSTPRPPTATAEKAPGVAKPVNAGIFFADPCRALDAAQRKKLGLDEGLEQPPRECDSLRGHDVVRLHFSTTDDGGLDQWYARSRTKDSKPVVVDGYPGLFPAYAEHADDCAIVVGLADKADFSVGFDTVGTQKKPDACGQAQTIATAVLATLRKLPPDSTAPPAPHAPKVTTPVPADAFVQKPCTSIGDTGRAALEQQGITLDAGKDDTTGPGHIACDYSGGKDLVVELDYVNDPQGLSALYERHHDGDFEDSWEPITMTGYPGVVTADSQCHVAVGITETRYFTVAAFFLDKPKPSCTQAKQVALAVLTTIR